MLIECAGDLVVVDLSGQNGSRAKFLLSYIQGYQKFDKKSYIPHVNRLMGLYYLLRYIFFDNFSSSLLLLHGNRVEALLLAIAKPFIKKNIVYDLGYPSKDIPRLKGLRKYIFHLSDILSVYFFETILVESRMQLNRLSSQGVKLNKIKIFHAIPNQIPPEFTNQYHQEPYSKYILFRGNYNEESGLEAFVKHYIRSSNEFKKKFPLIVLGRNCKAALKFHFSEASMKEIIFLNDFLDDAELEAWIGGSSFMVGQFGDESVYQRLKYTIPHKYFEALKYGVPYITLKRAALDEISPQLCVYLDNNCNMEKKINSYCMDCREDKIESSKRYNELMISNRLILSETLIF
jgi:hypothetical protein